MLRTGPGRRFDGRNCPCSEPVDGKLLLRVHACGVCRKDLVVLNGEARAGKLFVVPATRSSRPSRASTSGGRRAVASRGPAVPAACRSGRENLCDRARFTGSMSTAATRTTPSPTSASASRSPMANPTLQAAPLLCAGLIGHRALRMGRPATRPVRVRRCGAHYLPGGAPRGPAGVRVQAARATTRRRGPSRESSAPPGPVRRRARPELDAGISFAPAGELVGDELGRSPKGGSSASTGKRVMTVAEC